jgi:hypothetical protein
MTELSRTRNIRYGKPYTTVAAVNKAPWIAKIWIGMHLYSVKTTPIYKKESKDATF